MDSALGQVRQVLLKTRFWRRHAQTILSDRQIEVINRLLDAGPNGFEGGLNARKYRGLTSVSKATATRDLGDLLEKGVLCQLSGCGRSSGYAIDWPTGRNPTSWSRGPRPRGLRSSGKS